MIKIKLGTPNNGIEQSTAMFYYSVLVATFQSRTVLSSDADASSLESGEKATEQTTPLCPSSVRCSAPVAASQSRTVLSRDADASSLESGEKATDQTTLLCPSSVRCSAPNRFA